MAYPVAAAVRQHFENATTATIDLSGLGIVSGDLVVIPLSQDGGGTAISESTAYGWTVRNPSSVTGDARMAVAYKYSSGSESNPTFTGTASEAWSTLPIVIKDADPTSYVCGYASNTFTTNPAASPALTTVTADDEYGPILLLYAWCFDGTATICRALTNDLIELGKDAGDYIAEVTDRTISSIIGYRVQGTAGAVPSINAYGTAAAEGGNGWVLAIKNKSGGMTAPDVRSGATELQWYGNFGVVHQNPTWDAPSNFAATINSISADTTLADKANFFYAAASPWGTSTYLEVNTATEGWVGGSHAITSVDMTGKVFSLQWGISAITSTLNVGDDGVIVGFSDGTNWVVYQLAKKSMFGSANAQVVSHIALGNATAYASSGSINWAAVTRVLYAYHRLAAAGYTTMYVKNAALHGPSIIAGGGSTRPVKMRDLQTCLESWGVIGLVDKQGTNQIIGKNSVQIGDGSTQTYFKAAAASFEFPTAYSATDQYTWNANANSVDIVVKASASDTISLAAGVLATATRQGFTFHADSSGSASYPATGATLVGFDLTLDTDIPLSGATFSGGIEIVGAAADLTNCVIEATTSTDAAHSITANGAVLSGCTTDVTNTSAAYHLELGTSVTAVTLTDHTFTGTASSDKVHVLATTGTVTITISGTTSLFAGDVTSAGATVVISGPTINQKVTVSGITTGARVQIYDTTSSTELFNGTATAGDTVVSGSTVVWTDPAAAAADRAIRVRVSYVSGATAKNFIETSGLTCGQTAGTAEITYPVSPTDDTVYNANAITGSGVTGVTFTDAATDVVNINVVANAISWKTIYAAWVYYVFGATGIASDIDYIDAVDEANYILSNMIIKNTSSPTAPLEVTGGYGRDSVTGATIDLADTTGGTLIFAPDHVVSYAVGSGVTAQDITDIAAASGTAAATATLAAAQTTPIHSDVRKVVGITVDGTGTDGDPWGPA